MTAWTDLYFRAMTDGHHSRREYKKLRKKGCTPEQKVMESLGAINDLLNTQSKEGFTRSQQFGVRKWVKREIDIIKLLLPISKF